MDSDKPNSKSTNQTSIILATIISAVLGFLVGAFTQPDVKPELDDLQRSLDNLEQQFEAYKDGLKPFEKEGAEVDAVESGNAEAGTEAGSAPL